MLHEYHTTTFDGFQQMARLSHVSPNSPKSKKYGDTVHFWTFLGTFAEGNLCLRGENRANYIA